MLVVLALLPVFVARYPPLVDYPNHLARCYILRNLPHDPVLQRYYRNAMAAQPNLALDLIIPPLARVVSIWTAGRIFLGLTILAMAGGCMALHRALQGRWSSWPALGFMFVYNRLLLWGFLGYLFGLGVALAGAALWYALRERHWAVRLATGLAAATIIYLLHLYALGIYGVLVAGFEFADWLAICRGDRARAGRLAVTALQFGPAAYLFVLVSPTARAIGRIEWGGIAHKLTEPFKLIDAYHPIFDVACLFAVVAAVVILLLNGKVRLAPVMRVPLGLLAVLLIAMPNELFSSFGADRRIPVALALVGIAATDWHGASPKLRRGIIAALIVVLALRTGDITRVWARSQSVYQPYIAAFGRLPEGARLLASVPAEAPKIPPLYHVDAYAVIVRDVFLPSLFAAPEDAGSSVAFTPKFQALRRRTPGVVIWPATLEKLQKQSFAERRGPFRPNLAADYDAALVIDRRLMPPAARPSAACRVIARGQDFVLLGLPCPAAQSGHAP